MVDYNDGEWHGWPTGACPVHPESVVDVKFSDGEECKGYHAEDWNWDTDKIIAFRVTKPYDEPPKPREFWINEYPNEVGGAHSSKADADEYAMNNRIRCIHVREVIEE